MLHLSYRTKYEGEVETLELTRDPFKYGLGYYDDIHGVTWDVVCLIGGNYTKTGKPYINARPVTNSKYYSTATNGSSCGSHRWKPYYYVVSESIKSNKNEISNQRKN